MQGCKFLLSIVDGIFYEFFPNFHVSFFCRRSVSQWLSTATQLHLCPVQQELGTSGNLVISTLRCDSISAG
jgi:hypothetical protein